MNKKRFFQGLFLTMVVCVAFLFWYFDCAHILTLEHLQEYGNALKKIVSTHFLGSLIFFIMSYVVIVAFSLPGAAIFSLAGGFLFGLFIGTLANVLSATMGAAAAFLMTRYVLGNTIQQKFSHQLFVFNQELARYGIYYLLIIRLIPLFPFFLVNILSGFTQVSLKIFIITTVLGIIPGALIYTYAGTQLASLHTMQDILSGRFLMMIFIVVAFVLLSLLIKRMWQKNKH